MVCRIFLVLIKTWARAFKYTTALHQEVLQWCSFVSEYNIYLALAIYSLLRNKNICYAICNYNIHKSELVRTKSQLNPLLSFHPPPPHTQK